MSPAMASLDLNCLRSQISPPPLLPTTAPKERAQYPSLTRQSLPNEAHEAQLSAPTRKDALVLPAKTRQYTTSSTPSDANDEDKDTSFELLASNSLLCSLFFSISAGIAVGFGTRNINFGVDLASCLLAHCFAVFKIISLREKRKRSRPTCCEGTQRHTWV